MNNCWNGKSVGARRGEQWGSSSHLSDQTRGLLSSATGSRPLPSLSPQPCGKADKGTTLYTQILNVIKVHVICHSPVWGQNQSEGTSRSLQTKSPLAVRWCGAEGAQSVLEWKTVDTMSPPKNMWTAVEIFLPCRLGVVSSFYWVLKLLFFVSICRNNLLSQSINTCPFARGYWHYVTSTQRFHHAS